MEQRLIDDIVKEILARLAHESHEPAVSPGIPVGVSNRHIHLSPEHVQTLFGAGYSLTRAKALRQPGEFAAKETVTLVGPKGVIQGVRVLGPVRSFTQVEIARTDGFHLGITPPVRDSGSLAGSSGIVVVGPAGAITLTEGVICAARHIHMTPEDAVRFGVCDRERVAVDVAGLRGGTFNNVLVRVSPDYRLEFHIDTDEANAAELKNGDMVSLRKTGSTAGAWQIPPVPVSAGNGELKVPAAKKQVIDAAAVKQAYSQGLTSLVIPPGSIVTPLARDLAKEYQLRLAVSAR